MKTPYLPPIKRLVRSLRCCYAPLGGVCLAAGVAMQGAQSFPANFELSSLDGVTGFTIFGTRADQAGRSVSDAGDINGDGIADIVIGGGGDRSWIVFGQTDIEFPNVQELSSLDGNNGFTLQGNPGDRAGSSVSGAGDINHDGIDDLILGAPLADVNGTNSGQSFVVFGRTDDFPTTLLLSTLDGTNGFALNGIESGDQSGYSVSDAGDINGDTIGDIIIAAIGADPNGPLSGESYLVFGRSGGFDATLELSALDGVNGFTVNGVNAGDESSRSVSGAGDINSDGFDDLIIGAPGADPNGADSGQSAVVFGRSEGFIATLELSTLDGRNGFFLNGINADDQSGYSVSSAGDVNGDGFDDLIIGMPAATLNSSSRGQSAVIFGHSERLAATLELSALDGTNGFTLNGLNVGGYSGYSVSNAGDVNGDGFDDLIIGTPSARPNGTGSGQSSVIFGRSEGFATTLELSALDGSNGFSLNGVDSYQSGSSVSSAGDINGDGLDDLIIGAPSADPNGNGSGQGAVIFGRSEGFTAALELSELDGLNGFTLNGGNGLGLSRSVSGVGDINGDGFDDLIIGAFLAAPNGYSSGQSAVIFGRSEGFAATLETSALDGRNGFFLNGVDVRDRSSYSVSGAGDVNGDGLDDLIISAPFADPNGPNSGETVVVFGRSTGFATTLELSTLDGTNGFTLNGVNSGDRSGDSVSGAGDINGDGLDDLIIGARYADPNGSASGESAVVFGRREGFAATLELSLLDGDNGFFLNGVNEDDFSGFSVSGAGDINGDDLADLIIGAPGNFPVIFPPNVPGQSHVVFGRSEGFASMQELSALDGGNGFTLNGISRRDLSGWSVSHAGDVNSDGLDDLIIGARDADPNGFSSGQSLVIFGRSEGFAATLELSALDGRNGFILNGVNVRDRSGDSVSGAGDINGDGLDDLIIGVPFADPNGSSSGQSMVLFGRSDAFTATLELSALDGRNGFTLNGVNEGDGSGTSVSDAGDVSGDGLDDLIILALGKAHIVFGTQADLTLTITDELDPVDLNTNLDYTITVANQGPTYTSGVEVGFIFPATMNFIGSSPQNWTCNLSTNTCSLDANLLADTSETLILSFNTGNQPMQATVTATVTSSDFDPQQNNNSASETTTIRSDEIFDDQFE